MREIVSPLDGFSNPFFNRGDGAAFSVALTGLTDGEARIGDHASIGYTTDPVSATETVKWSNSFDPAAAATYGTGASPTDYTAGDEGALWLHVTDGGETVSRSAPIRYAPGTAPAIADGQTFTVDTAITAIDASASGANLTFTYALSGAPAGLSINSGTGSITGTPTAASSGTATITATDQYGRTVQDTFTFTASLRTQATGGTDLDLAFPEDSAITSTDLIANWTDNGNTLTFVSVSPALPTGLSISSAGAMTGTPTTVTADATYTLTMEDEYGRQTSDTFTLEITAASDSTAPVFNSASYSSPNLTLNITEASGAATLVWATADTATDPTFTIAGGWVGTTYETGSYAVTAGANSDNIGLTATTPAGSRELSLYAYDASNNLSLVERVAFTMPDITAPALSTPVDAANGSTAATGSVDTNEGNGTLYWVVSTSATAPTAAQVKAGNDHTGSAAADSGSQAVSGTGTQTLSPAPSGLTASTTYYIHFMHEDAATNQSAVSSGDGFTTAAPSAGNDLEWAAANSLEWGTGNSLQWG